MLKPSEIRDIRDRDVSDMPRDILEFNYRALAKGSLEWMELQERLHHEDMARLRNMIDVGAHVTALIAKAQRAGKKTVRIADVLGEAQRRVDESR